MDRSTKYISNDPFSGWDHWSRMLDFNQENHLGEKSDFIFCSSVLFIPRGMGGPSDPLPRGVGMVDIDNESNQVQ